MQAVVQAIASSGSSIGADRLVMQRVLRTASRMVAAMTEELRALVPEFLRPIVGRVNFGFIEVVVRVLGGYVWQLLRTAWPPSGRSLCERAAVSASAPPASRGWCSLPVHVRLRGRVRQPADPLAQWRLRDSKEVMHPRPIDPVERSSNIVRLLWAKPASKDGEQAQRKRGVINSTTTHTR